MAAGIRGARFGPLEGRSHLFLETGPAFGRLVQKVHAFFANGGSLNRSGSGEQRARFTEF
jgi:hypothetical protein